MILNPATPIEMVSGDRPFRAGNGGRVTTKHEKKDHLRCAFDTLLHRLSFVLSPSSAYHGTQPCGIIALLTWFAYICTFRTFSLVDYARNVPFVMKTMVTIFTLSTTRQLKQHTNQRNKQLQRRTNGSGMRRKLYQCVDLLYQVLMSSSLLYHCTCRFRCYHSRSSWSITIV